eukprot:COSAG05_NODE_1342_length_5140_cov_2.897838_12_plen_80_part_00
MVLLSSKLSCATLIVDVLTAQAEFEAFKSNKKPLSKKEQKKADKAAKKEQKKADKAAKKGGGGGGDDGSASEDDQIDAV